MEEDDGLRGWSNDLWADLWRPGGGSSSRWLKEKSGETDGGRGNFQARENHTHKGTHEVEIPRDEVEQNHVRKVSHTSII